MTGSTAGLGCAIAESLARAGARVILNGLASPRQGEAAAVRLSADTGYEAAFDGADLRDVGAIERMIRGGVARFGTIDIVVNNAVVRHFKPIQAFTAQWDTSLAVNLSAAGLSEVAPARLRPVSSDRLHAIAGSPRARVAAVASWTPSSEPPQTILNWRPHFFSPLGGEVRIRSEDAPKPSISSAFQAFPDCPHFASSLLSP